MIIIELDEQVRRIHPVYPARALIHRHRLAFSGHRITQDHLADGLSAEETDRKILHRTDPIRRPLIIDLKAQLIEDIRGITKTQMPVDIPVKIFGLGVTDPR